MIGRGSFGVVVLAESKDQSFWIANCDITGTQLRCDQGLTRVAVKMMKPGKGEEPIAMREGLVLSSIGAVERSGLVPRCLDYGISNGVVYVVLEYLDGAPLDQVVAREVSLHCFFFFGTFGPFCAFAVTSRLYSCFTILW